MTRLKTIIFLALLSLLASCRSFEGLNNLERDAEICLKVESSETVGSLSVFAPGLNPIAAISKGGNEFSFVRPSAASSVPCWFALAPGRTDARCDAQTSILTANLPCVQYPAGTDADKFSLLAVSAPFNIGIDRIASVQTPDTVLAPVRVKVSGLQAGDRLFSLSFTNDPDSLGLAGTAVYDIKNLQFVQPGLRTAHSLALMSPDGILVSENGTVELTAVTFPDVTEYRGASKIFVSTDNALYSYAADSLDFDGYDLNVNLAAGFKKSAGSTVGFNDANLYNTLRTAKSAKVVASDGTEMNLEFSQTGCVGRNEQGVCYVNIPAGASLTIPAVTGKEVTGILFHLTGYASEDAKFNVFSGDKLIHTFNSTTQGDNGALTALSLTDLPEELEILDLAGLKIVPASEASSISGIVLTIIDYIDPHKWEDGHIDDQFNNLFDIL